MKTETVTGLVQEGGELEGVEEVQAKEGALPDEGTQEKKGKAEKKAGKRIGYNYIIIKSLKESKKNDVVKCLYIKSLTKWGFCVIKEGTYGDTKDKEGRDIKDRLMWQQQLHELLQDKVRVPRLLGSFEENGNYYLVIEHIKGITIGNYCRKHGRKIRESLLAGTKMGRKVISYLIDMVTLLETLHQQGVVHRDVSSANFMITRGGKMALIDLELSYSTALQAPAPAFELGTHGYMSPQQLAMHTPTIEEDFFAIGANILQIWTNVSPSRLTNVPADELEAKVRFFIPDQQLADIVILCLASNVADRPSMSKLRSCLQDYRSDLLRRSKRPQNKQVLFSRDQLLDTIQQGLNALSSPLLADPEKGWFADDIHNPDPDKHKIKKAYYGSFSVGTAGVMYLVSMARKVGFDVDAALPHVQKGLELIQKKYISRATSTSPSLHNGASGTAVCLAAAIRSGLIQDDPIYQEWISLLLDKKNEEYGFAGGMSGVGIANLSCKGLYSEQEILPGLTQSIQFLLESQKPDGSWAYPVKKGKPRVSRGFSRGMAGIVYFLMEFAKQTNNQQVATAGQAGLQWLIKHAHRHKDTIDWKSNSGKTVYPTWRDGAPGIGLAFLKGWEATKDPIYRRYVIGALNMHGAEVLDNNISQFTGITGLGEIYLEAFNTLQDDHWLHRANWICQSLQHMKKGHPKFGVWWNQESDRNPVPGFMNGSSGVLHFLIRYAFKEQIGLPLLPANWPHSQVSALLQTDLLTLQTEII
ncbi:MAG: protein kinase [Candidatus Pseudobacter hemicellulosilyticus]|uniref:non-specific serine/threonine protein kinase n=1 Tax=Candidatus Pseudobacter hemicellulosilyticus TaxID=3121375 RepID=A0AAJ5WRK1_9BACT|nr:MAG: protein kinase [Pseudobacter sp.]